MTSLPRSIIRVLRLGVELPLRGILSAYYLILYFVAERPLWKSAAGARVHPGTTQPTGLWCIFAIAPGRRISQNLIAFLSCLKDAGYNVILLNNGAMPNELTGHFLPYCHSVIERPLGGRDFGGYKWGTQTLFKLGGESHDISQVIYCNDSTFIRPSTLRLLLQRIRQLDSDYIGITESFEPRYHVQSWFFAASGKLFHSPEFQSFWREYTPLSYRPHCINKGEVGIVEYLAKHSIHPLPLYTQAIILDLICQGVVSDAVIKLLSGLSPGHYRDLVGTMQRIGFAKSPPDPNIALSFLRRDIMEEIGMANTMYTANLILLRHMEFPFLKKDLVYRGDYLVTQIESAIAEWAGDDADHLPEIYSYFRERGTLRRQYSPAAILARMGLI